MDSSDATEPAKSGVLRSSNFSRNSRNSNSPGKRPSTNTGVSYALPPDTPEPQHMRISKMTTGSGSRSRSQELRTSTSGVGPQLTTATSTASHTKSAWFATQSFVTSAGGSMKSWEVREEEAYLGSVVAERYVDLDPFVEAVGYFKEQQRRLDVNSLITTRKATEETRFGCLLSEEEIEQLLQEELVRVGMQNTLLMDFVFGLVILANGVMMGLTTQGVVDEESMEAQIFEIVCVGLFTIEFLLHWLFERLHRVKRCCASLRSHMRDNWAKFDLTCLVLAWLDLLMTYLIEIEGGTSAFAVLRVLRLMRLLRLLRLLKIMQQLWLLLSSMVAAMRVLSWATAMLVCICYIFGILVYELTKGSLGTRPDLAADWNGVVASMLSLAQIATFSGIDLIRRRIDASDGWLFMPALFLFMAIASLGIINLIVGVLLTAVLDRGDQDDMFESTVLKLRQHRALRRLRFGLCLHAEKTLGRTKEGKDDSHLVSRRILQGWARGPDAELDKQEEEAAEEDDDETLQEQIQNIRANLRRDSPDNAGSSENLVGKGVGVKMKRQAGPCGRCCAAVYSRFCMRPLTSMKRIMRSRLGTVQMEPGEIEDLRSELPGLFSAAGVSMQDIDAVCSEVENLMGDNAGITIDEFIESMVFMKSRAHPLDIVGVMRGLWLIYERMSSMDAFLELAGNSLKECSTQIQPLLQKMSSKEATVRKAVAAISELSESPEMHERRRIFEEQEARLFLESQTAFDMFFAVVLVLNAVKLGVDVVLLPPRLSDLTARSFQSPAMAWFMLEALFTLTFTAELFLRAIFKYQMEVMGEHELFLLVVPKIASTLTFNQVVDIIKYSWRLFMDKLFLFDVITVLVSLLDTFVLRFAGNQTPALRLVSLLRLLRLVRLLHLVKDLSRLVNGFVGNIRFICRSVIMMTIFIYANAILMVEFVGRSEDTQNDANIQAKWGNIPSSMLSLLTMSTYSSWSLRVAEVAAYPSLAIFMPIFAILFLAICSLGMLNLVTGVMVQTAFSFLKDDSKEKSIYRLVTAREQMHKVMGQCYDDMHRHVEREQQKVKERVNRIREKHTMRFSTDPTLVSQLRSGSVDTFATTESWTAPVPVPEAPARPGGAQPTPPPEEQFLVSAFDDDNYAEVTRCLWVSEEEVGVDVLLTLNPKLSPDADSDPMKSLLTWEGGKAEPCLVLQQTDHIQHQPEGDEEAGQQQRVRTSSQTIVFRPVSLSKATETLQTLQYAWHIASAPGTKEDAIRLRYGGNFTVVKARAATVPGAGMLAAGELEDLMPVDQTLVTMRELNYLLQDKRFAKSLELIGMRPDQALMVYQKLNLTKTERVKAFHFIEAILRMKRPLQGLDVAVSKSMMRRLVLEVESLATNCIRCQDCFRSVSEKLREVEILEDHAEVATTESRMEVEKNAAADEEAVESHETRAKVYYADLMRRNRQLELKIASIKAFVRHARKETAEDEGLSLAHLSRFSLHGGSLLPRGRARGSSNQETKRPRSASPGLPGTGGPAAVTNGTGLVNATELEALLYSLLQKMLCGLVVSGLGELCSFPLSPVGAMELGEAEDQSLHLLSQELAHQQGLIAHLRREVDSCREEVGALRDCLSSNGTVDSVRFLVHLHRRRFDQACAVYGLGPCAPLDAVIDIRAVAYAIGSFAGYSAMRALREVCQAARSAAADILDPLCPGHLYLCGGFEGALALSSVERLDPHAGVWEVLPPMTEARQYTCAGVMAGKIYVCGGWAGPQPVRSVECFDPDYSRWSPMPPMLVARWGAGAGVINKRLFICGGLDENRQPLNSVECFTPPGVPMQLLHVTPRAPQTPTGSWQAVSSMAERRGWPAAVSLQGLLYVCGGRDEQREPLSSVERLNHPPSIWLPLPPLSSQRAGASAAACGGRLYVCGGAFGAGDFACGSGGQSTELCCPQGPDAQLGGALRSQGWHLGNTGADVETSRLCRGRWYCWSNTCFWWQRRWAGLRPATRLERPKVPSQSFSGQTPPSQPEPSFRGRLLLGLSAAALLARKGLRRVRRRQGSQVNTLELSPEGLGWKVEDNGELKERVEKALERGGLQGTALRQNKQWPSKGEVLRAIPKDCMVKETGRSLAHAAVSTLQVLFCGYLAWKYIPMTAAFAPMWLLYAVVQGTLATGPWVIGHECGHNAFCNEQWLQTLVGYVLHSALMVPYFSWQRSHAVHHSKTNHMTEGETHVPRLQKGSTNKYQNLAKWFGQSSVAATRMITHLVLGWPAYILGGATGGPAYGTTNHMWPFAPFRNGRKELFPKAWKSKVLLSDVGIVAMAGILMWWAKTSGFMPVFALYLAPLMVTNCWLVLYTWLQHTDVDIPHFDEENWTWVKGAFHTVDRPYGPVLDYVHHRIGSTHVAHHVCSAIPFYKARKATEALKEKFPDLYLYDPTPIHKALWRVSSRCTAVQKAEGNDGMYIFT
ncbi:FAD2 [Symbiodinium necroappetens]|uniref:FAD2 protein n=1 Tax=Symbiodinium necroappetens TaxID=1628268 RepID=A0A812J4Q5_9DINO|nr:FAD2 [Symbiodinium necroappetens]